MGAVDQKLQADRMSVISDVVAMAGVADVSQGAELPAASEDVGVLSAMVGLMSLDGIEHGFELAPISGEL